MAERINLEVPADLSSRDTVLTVVTGICARLDYSLDDLDDVRLAMEMLLGDALELEKLETIAVQAEIDGGSMKLTAGPFQTAELRRRVSVGRDDCIDLCLLLRRTMDAVTVEGDDSSFVVVLERRPRGPSR
ncbi:MAG: hypothetical protein WCN81_10195 [Actinomycetes bacterium]